MDNSPSHQHQTADAELGYVRSQVLDAFSEIELAIARLLIAAGNQPKGPHLGSMVEAFRKIEGIPGVAKANHPKRDDLANKICELLPVRADIVHSQMKVCRVDGVASAQFVNSQNASQSYPECRLLSVKHMIDIANAARTIASGIAQLNRINPPSSPPLPSPGAAAVP